MGRLDGTISSRGTRFSRLRAFTLHRAESPGNDLRGSELIKIGVLGTGFGIVHLQTFQNHPLVNEVVFFSRTQSKVDKISAEMGLKGTTVLDDILCDPAVDAVTIALPHALHARTAIAAMEHGKDVICEVPICPTLEEAEEIAEVSSSTGKRVLVNLFSRFSPAHCFLQEKIKTGEYGKLLSLQLVNRNAPVWGPVPLGLDILPLESCACDFDWLYWCLGELSLSSNVSIELKNRACIDMLLRGPEKIPVQMTCSTLMPLSYGVKERIDATFEKAVIVYQETSWSNDGNSFELSVYDDEQKHIICLPKCNHYYASLTYSLERIIDGRAGITDLQQAIPALRLGLELKHNLS